MLLKETIAVYSENHPKYLNALCGKNAELMKDKPCGIYGYHWSLKG
jgi:hypothetical protein